jgi:hypothetical protein
MGSLAGCRAGTQRSFLLAYVASGTLAGAAAGGFVSCLGQVPRVYVGSHGRMYLFSVVLIMLGLLQRAGREGVLPSVKFAVPAEWVRTGGAQAGCLWGLVLGPGFLTYQTGVLFHAYAVGLLLTDSWIHGVTVGAVFGLVRTGFPILPPVRQRILEWTGSRQGRGTLLTARIRAMATAVLLTAGVLSLAQVIHKGVPR